MYRVAVVLLLVCCVIALTSLSCLEWKREERREEAAMRAIYRDLGNGDVDLGQARYEARRRIEAEGRQ